MKTKKIIRRLACAFVVLAMAFVGGKLILDMTRSAEAAQISVGAVKINGVAQTMTTTPFIDTETGAVYVPIAEFFEKMGIKMTYHGGDYDRYTGAFSRASIVIPMNQDSFIFDGVTIEVPGVTKKVGGVDMFDMTYICDIYGVSDCAMDSSEISLKVQELDRRTDAEKAIAALDTTGMTSVTSVPTSVERHCIDNGNGGWCGWNDERGNTVGVDLAEDDRPCDETGCEFAYKITSNQSYPGGWENIGVGLNRSGGATVQVGEVGVVTFWARVLEVNDVTAEGKLSVRAQNSGNNTAGGKTFDLTHEWQQYSFAFRVPESAPFTSGRLYFTGGALEQVVQFTGARFWNFGNTLDANFANYVEPDRVANKNYKNQEAGALWRTVAARRIEKYRKNDLKIVVRDQVGNKLSGANVSVDMTKNEFHFGTATPSRFATTTDYTEKVLELFNSITAENAMKWTGYNEAFADGVVAFAEANNIGVRGHNLVWEGPNFLPSTINTSAKIQALGEDGTGAIIKDHIDYMLSRYDSSAIYEWDVLNEPFIHNSNGFIRNNLGSEFLSEYIFCYVQQNYPNVVRYINDYNLVIPSRYNTGMLLDLVDEFESYDCGGGNNVIIDGIGLQYYPSDSSYGNFDPQDYYNNLVRLTEKVEKVAMTEYRAGGADSSTQYIPVATDLLADLLIATYSMPKATGFTLWGFYNTNAAYQNQNILFDVNGNPQDGYYIWKNAQDYWSTHEAGTANADGEYLVRAYNGDYAINVEYGGKEQDVAYTVANGNSNELVVVLNIEGATPPGSLSDNNKLSSLSVSGSSGSYNLTPAFDQNVTTYQVDIPNNVTNITIGATKQDETATITSGVGSVTITAVGITPVEVVVVAENGDQKVYTMNVNRAAAVPSSNSKLALLSVKDVNLQEYITNFDAGILAYNVVLPSGTTFVDITAEADEYRALVYGAGRLGGLTDGSARTVSVIVTAADNSTTTYTVRISVEPVGDGDVVGEFIINGNSHTIGDALDKIFKVEKDYVDESEIEVFIDDGLVGGEFYGISRGSTVVTLLASYLDTVAVGTHTLRVVYADGVEARGTFYVLTGAPGNGTPGLPGTGEERFTMGSVVMTMTSAAIVLLIVIAVVLKKGLRKKVGFTKGN